MKGDTLNVLNYHVKRAVSPRYEAAYLQYGLSDDQTVAVEDLRPNNERDVPKLVLESDEYGVGTGMLSSNDQSGDCDLGPFLQTRYVLAWCDVV